jgi:hypothetical protein
MCEELGVDKCQAFVEQLEAAVDALHRTGDVERAIDLDKAREGVEGLDLREHDRQKGSCRPVSKRDRGDDRGPPARTFIPVDRTVDNGLADSISDAPWT